MKREKGLPGGRKFSSKIFRVWVASEGGFGLVGGHCETTRDSSVVLGAPFLAGQWEVATSFCERRFCRIHKNGLIIIGATLCSF